MRRSHLRTTLWLLGVLVLAGAAASAVWLLSAPPGTPPGDPNDPAEVGLGRTVYQENCAACHGDRLEGQPDWRVRDDQGYLPAPPHDETGHTWHHPDPVLFDITKNGTAAAAAPGYRTTMMGFADELSDQEIWAVLAFIKSRWPAEIRRRQAEATRRSAP
jgi:mono/diheme cytochrome c family protein